MLVAVVANHWRGNPGAHKLRNLGAHNLCFATTASDLSTSKSTKPSTHVYIHIHIQTKLETYIDRHTHIHTQAARQLPGTTRLQTTTSPSHVGAPLRATLIPLQLLLISRLRNTPPYSTPLPLGVRYNSSCWRLQNMCPWSPENPTHFLHRSHSSGQFWAEKQRRADFYSPS